MFKTANVKLEQFLFMHDINHVSFGKNDDGLTEWSYNESDELNRVVAEFREIQRRRNEKRRSA